MFMENAERAGEAMDVIAAGGGPAGLMTAALLDAAESNIKPRDELQLGKYTHVSATTLHRTNMELWRTIAAVALAVLLFEWWYYHRRTV